MFIIISGCSGSGKNTLIQELLNDDKKLRFLKSCTTRDKRDIEKSDSYIYLSKDEFEKMLEEEKLFEYEKIHDYYYGTLNSSVDEILEGKYDYIKDIGVVGHDNFRTGLEGKTKVISIFIDVPKEELKKRLEARGEQEIDKRLSRYEFENLHKPKYDYVIKNLDKQETLEKLKEIISENR